MPWQKKFPGVAGMIAPPTAAPAAPSMPPVGQAPVGLASLPQPAPMQSSAPRVAPEAPGSDEIKKRALANIAMGKKGF
jgi:hypothetical protein